MIQDMIVILDLGGMPNVTTGIARQIRDLGVYSEIHPHDKPLREMQASGNIKGIILSGGPNNIVKGEKIDILPEIYSSSYPILSINHKTSEPCEFWDALPDDKEELEDKMNKFVFNTCHAEPNWNMQNFIADQIAALQRQIGDNHVLLALSGGVDSSVVAALLIKAIGKQLTCVHVNHGLLRKGEPEQVVDIFGKRLDANLVYVDATERFLNRLAGVAEPEAKRKIIGEEFIRVFEEEARKLSQVSFLGQGTIYPDIIESGTKTTQAIKAHHNVGGLPDDLKFELVEPLKQLFKDEVRACGVALGLPPEMVYRQPFPGPGLGVRCLGAITKDRLEAVRESDAILRQEFEKHGLADSIWQYFTVIPDTKSVGVRHDARTFEYPVIIRAIHTIDAMTATVPHIDWEILEGITNRILAEVDGVNRVCYDLSPKPPGTIEWE